MLSNQIIKIISIILPFVCCNVHATSDIYKWTDENGQIQYGEKPHNEFNAKIVSQNQKYNSNESLVIEKPVKIVEQEEMDVTRYFLLANERINKFSRWPTTIVINNDKLWITFEHSVLSFDLLEHQSKKYNLKKLTGHVSTRNMYFSDDSFIFLAKDKKTLENIFHVYNHKTQEYNKWPTDNNLNRIILYENSEDMLIIGGSNSALSLFKNIKYFNEKDSKKTIKYTVDMPGSLSNNYDTIWYTHWNKPNEAVTCSVGYFFKNDSKYVKFNHKEIGFPKHNRCGWIISDDEEVWVTSNSREKGSYFAVYNIKNNKWDPLAISKNGFPVNQSPLQLDENNLYYNSCENLIALNRKSRNSSVINTDIFSDDDKSRYCIYGFKLYEDHVWVLKFEPYKYKLTPVLYKIPVKMFDKKIIKYYRK